MFKPARYGLAGDAVTLPGEPEIERILLGAILLNEDPAQVELARRKLCRTDFTVPGNREIFECLSEMAIERSPISPVILISRLRAKGSSVTPVDIAMLTDGVPRLSDLSTEIQILKEIALRREIIRCSDTWILEAQANDVNLVDLSRAIAARSTEFGRGTVAQGEPIAIAWEGLCEMNIERRETILHEVERGEIVMCPAITNRGKTTLWRNLSLSLACGREFPPLVKAGMPRSVLYLDFETRLWKLRNDITTMLGRLSVKERALVAKNFNVIADCRIQDRPLTLSSLRHLEILEEEARRCNADILIIDTLTAAFEIENENDNAEGSRVMKKLTSLAQRLNCVIVFLHHVGKTKQEEGHTVHAVHRARGGSAYSGFSHAIFNLLPDPVNRERLTLECAKVKGERFEDTVLNLDPASRWFSAGGPAEKAVSPYDQIICVFEDEPLRRSAIQKLLPAFNVRSLDRYLKEAVEAGDLVETKRGIYQKSQSRQSGHLYKDVHSVYFDEVAEHAGYKLDFGDSRKTDDDEVVYFEMDAVDR